jgi:hypothetical protein
MLGSRRLDIALFIVVWFAYETYGNDFGTETVCVVGSWMRLGFGK